MSLSSGSPVGTPHQLILIVDDDSLVCLALRAEFEPRHEVRSVGTIREARAYLASGGPLDAVILDIGLPDGSGLTFMRDLARARPAVPTLVLSGHDGIQDQARAAGAAAFMAKPFQVAEVSDRVEALLAATP